MDRRRSLLKIAALRSERERQVGVNIGKEQNIDSSSITAFIGAPVPIGTGDFTLEYFGNAYWATKSKTPLIFNDSTHSTYSKGSFLVYGDSELAIRWVLFEAPMSGAPTDDSILLSAGDRETPFHFVVTRKGTTVKAYFNGELKATKEQSAVKDLGDFRLGMSNGSNMIMSRIYNYELSAEEVAAHYNDGDPAVYVLPKLYRQFGPNIELTADTFEFNIDSPEYQIVIPSRQYSYDCIYRIDYVVDEWDFQPERYNIVGFNGVAGASIIAGNYLWYTPQQAKIGEVQSCFVKMPMGRSAGVWCFAGEVRSDTTARHLKVTIKGITPVGCVAEYLPQNIRITQKRDFPQVLFPVADYTPSNRVFTPNYATTSYQYNVPQANGFSGDFMRFEAMPDVSNGRIVTECSYWQTYLAKKIPVKITVAYRCNYDIYSSQSSTSPNDSTLKLALPANEGNPITTVLTYGLGYGAYLFGDLKEDSWLELRVLSIEVIEGVALSWLDSARKLPLNDEYLPPLLQSDGGYDLTANGTPEIIIK